MRCPSVPSLCACRRTALLLIAGFVAWQGLQAETGLPDDSAERQRITRQRQASEQRLAQEEAVCLDKFMATDCLNKARARHRAALSELRRQEVALNDAVRRRKGELRLQQLQEQASTPSVSPEAQAEARGQQAEREARAVRKQAEHAERQAQAASERQHHDERLRRAEEKRAAHEARLRARTKPAAQPLPAEPQAPGVPAGR